MDQLITTIDLSPTGNWVLAGQVVSMVGCMVLVIVLWLFGYFSNTVKKEHFNHWAAGWLFYTVYIAASIASERLGETAILNVVRLTCAGVGGLLILWGSLQLAPSPVDQNNLPRYIGGLAVIVLLWSCASVYLVPDKFLSEFPGFALLSGSAFYGGWKYKSTFPVNRGTKMVSISLFIWSCHLLAFPFLNSFPSVIAGTHFSSAIFAFALSMSVIVEHELVGSEKKYRVLLDSARDAIFLVDLWTLQILDVNQPGLRLVQSEAADLVGRSFLDLCPGLRSEGTGVVDNHKMFEAVFRPYSEFKVLRSNGGYVLCEGETNLVQSHKRPVLQINIREVGEAKKVGMHIRRAEKLSAVGQLVAGVAHELNNPLAVIMGYSQLLIKRSDIADKVRKELTKIHHESERAAKIVRNILTFVRPSDPQMQPADINRLLTNVLEMREANFGPGKIRLIKNLAPRLPRTKVDTSQLEQVFTNLVVNAIHALTDYRPTGTISVTTEENGFFIRVIIGDSGPGISRDKLSKIFDPFFTTKSPGKGTGLGLTISHSIVSEHRGKLTVKSVEGKGTEFTVELPIIPCEQELEPTPDLVQQITPDPQASSRRLLLVDDEPGIIEVMKEVLSGNGYSLETAGNGRLAMQKILNSSYDLIISDMRMPEMDGEKLYETLREKKPEMAKRIIFVTGDTVSVETREFLESTGNRWLSKPFNIMEIEQMVGSILSNNGAATSQAVNAG